MLVNDIAKVDRAFRNVALAIFVVVAAMAMHDHIIVPHKQYLAAARQCEAVLTNMVKKNKMINGAINIKKKKLKKLQEQSAALGSALFTPKQAKEFFSDLQAIAEETGCVVYSLNLIGSEPLPELKKTTTKPKSNKKGKDAKGSQKNTSQQDSENKSGIIVSGAGLSVVGTYVNITKLMARLQSRAQKVWVDSLQIEGVDNSPGSLRCDLTVTVYVAGDKEASAL